MACKGRVIWSREAETTLIEAVREHPVLWDEIARIAVLRRQYYSSWRAVAGTGWPLLLELEVGCKQASVLAGVGGTA